MCLVHDILLEKSRFISHTTNWSELDTMALTLIPEVFIIYYLCLFVNLNELKLTPSSAHGGQHRKRTDGADLRWLAQPLSRVDDTAGNDRSDAAVQVGPTPPFLVDNKAFNELWPHTKRFQSEFTVTDKFPMHKIMHCKT